ncbi:TerB family tellurite resistance protein [Oceanibium sediminis]|uniref:tellurite resistance TerB family protein n=1 Tax=Oceanibium sediminis TaxID=2026339 RepID=UPI000DD45860|nr:TerB family tellurite resistance protein [Oceanibium sediminis]
MFADLMNRLLGTAPQPDPEEDYRQSLAALLVRCAKVDYEYAAAEQARIDEILALRYGLDAHAAAALRGDGETLEAEAGDTVHLTQVIKNGVPHEERGAILEALWSVALADEARDHTENAFMRLAVKLLGLSDVENGIARQKAKAALD